ncbi:MAG: hypothetical protein KAS87_03405 [Candidatus Omnitrophica bacterium]|nr:hypothetical protein [Candidatus Omnitrophota bacterium]
MKNIWAIIGGVVAVILGLLALIKWGPAILIILQGVVVFALIAGGVITVAVGISNVKEKLSEKKEEKQEKKEEKK